MSFKIVPKEHWDIITEYLDEPGVTLVSEEFMKENNITQEDIEKCNESYDFGGDADIWVDKVSSKQHCFILPLFEED